MLRFKVWLDSRIETDPTNGIDHGLYCNFPLPLSATHLLLGDSFVYFPWRWSSYRLSGSLSAARRILEISTAVPGYPQHLNAGYLHGLTNDYKTRSKFLLETSEL